MPEHFVDTCVIVGYAANIPTIPDVEPYGLHCERFFNENIIRICSKNVEKEVERVRRKRMALYKYVCESLSRGLEIYQIGVMDKKQREHLESILESLRKENLITEQDKVKTVTILRLIGQIFEQRIKDALSKIKEVIDVDKLHDIHEKVSWAQLLGNIIGNYDDGKILVDCIILSHYRGYLIFVTIDRKDIVNNRDKISKFANDYCSISIKPNFDIYHITELYPKL